MVHRNLAKPNGLDNRPTLRYETLYFFYREVPLLLPDDNMQSALNIWRLNVVLKYVNAECSVGKQTPSPEQYSLERLVRKHDQN